MHVADPTLTMPDDGQPIWRYLDFAKFVALLDSSAIYFPRADTFVDTFEVAVPVADRAAAREAALAILTGGEVSRAGILAYIARHTDRSVDELARMPDERIAREMLRLSNRALFVSCWHMNDEESAAMWDVYLGGRDGVALQTTVGILRDELDRGSGDETPVFLGAVTYLDYARQSWGAYRPFNAVMHKRRSFAHETELRAVVIRPTWAEMGQYAGRPEDVPNLSGLSVPIDLDRLVRRVVISPRAEAWFVDLVSSMLRRFGLSQTPLHSDLYGAPVF
jgi:hypothetical protein